MSTYLSFPVLLALALAGPAAFAADAPTPAPTAAAASASAQAAPSGSGCTGAMARHDHGATKNMPAPMPACSGDDGAAPVAKARLRHDHGKFHKNM